MGNGVDKETFWEFVKRVRENFAKKSDIPKKLSQFEDDVGLSELKESVKNNDETIRQLRTNAEMLEMMRRLSVQCKEYAEICNKILQEVRKGSDTR